MVPRSSLGPCCTTVPRPTWGRGRRLLREGRAATRRRGGLRRPGIGRQSRSLPVDHPAAPGPPRAPARPLGRASVKLRDTLASHVTARTSCAERRRRDSRASRAMAPARPDVTVVGGKRGRRFCHGGRACLPLNGARAGAKGPRALRTSTDPCQRQDGALPRDGAEHRRKQGRSPRTRSAPDPGNDEVILRREPHPRHGRDVGLVRTSAPKPWDGRRPHVGRAPQA